MPDLTAQTSAAAPDRKPSLKERARDEAIRGLIMFLYLWFMFTLFNLHEYLVLASAGLSYWKIGLGFVNALVFAKVMLLADNIKVGAWMRTQALVVPILARALLFAVLFIVVHVLESVVEGLIHHERIADSLPSYGGGFLGALATAVVIAAALIPFLAFEELDLAIGPGTIRALLLTPRPVKPRVREAVEALERATHEK